jgi:Zn finger protein HypA/HybF involved in hydrogenase expression
MHEMGIAKNILDIVFSELSMREITEPVEKIVFRINRMNAIFPESLNFFFDSMKADYTKLENSKLEFIIDPFIGICTNCKKKIESEEMIFTCNVCGSNMELEPIQEMCVESFTIKKEENQIGN